jgi:fructose-bisphosphate aldolase class II
MTASKENRTLAILNAASAGNYGVMAAIAYEPLLSNTKE